jgi:hypothetical protein
VLSILKDSQRAQAIVDAAYHEVACNPANSFRAFVDSFDQVIANAFLPSMKASLSALDRGAFEQFSGPSWATKLRWMRRRAFEGAYRFLFSTLLGRARPETRETLQSWLKFALYPLRLMLAHWRSWLLSVKKSRAVRR